MAFVQVSYWNFINLLNHSSCCIQRNVKSKSISNNRSAVGLERQLIGRCRTYESKMDTHFSVDAGRGADMLVSYAGEGMFMIGESEWISVSI